MFERSFGDILLAERSIGRSVLHGVLAGIAGGIGYGTLMMIFRPNMLIGIGGLIGLNSIPGGWMYHLFISMTIGSIFGLVIGRLASTYRFGLMWGLLYGLNWWVLGGLILSPLMANDMDRLLVVNPNSWIGIVGHLIYGSITGLVTVFLNKRF